MKAIGIGLIAFIVVLIIGASAGTLYYLSLQAPAPQQLPNLSGSSAAAVAQLKNTQLYRSLSNGPISASLLTKPSNASNSTQQFNITYAGRGSVTANLGGVSLPFALPLKVISQKYNNDSRLSVSLSGIPVVGNLNLSMIRLGSSTYTCAPKNPLNKSSPSFCSLNSGQNSSSLTLLSLLSLLGSNLKLNVNQYYPSQFNQTYCVFINSTFSISSQSSQSGAGTLQTCIAPQNNLPVTLSLLFNSNQKNATISSISLTLAQSQSSSVVSDNAIRALPAPVSK